MTKQKDPEVLFEEWWKNLEGWSEGSQCHKTVRLDDGIPLAVNRSQAKAVFLEVYRLLTTPTFKGQVELMDQHVYGCGLPTVVRAWEDIKKRVHASPKD